MSDVINPDSINSPNTLKTQIADQVAAAKSTGSTRASRIQAILKTAVSETVGEVKAGSQDFQAIAQDSFSTVVENFAEQPVAPEATLKQRLKAALLGLVKQFKFQAQSQASTKVKQQWSELDAELHQRFGDRYQNLRSKAVENTKAYVDNIPGWNDNRRTQGQTPLEQHQLQLEVVVGDLGSRVAKQETSLRQQLKQFLTNTANKL
jgi:hypothetical protein